MAEHLEQYADNFHLDIIPSTTLQSTTYDLVDKKWTFRLETANRAGSRTVISKHLVQATGLGSSRPYLPPMEDESLYSGTSLHSAQYRNAKLLAEQGVKVRTLYLTLAEAALNF